MPQTRHDKTPHQAKSAEAQAPNAPKNAGANEGEGNKTAARRYNRATVEYGQSGRVERAAKAAEKALEGPERAELERAEQVGKSKSSDIEREADREGLDAEREAPEERDEDA
jgi:hypothetical protein